MSDPSPKLGDKPPSRITALFRRKWQWKDVVIALLGLLFVSMSAYAFREPIGHAFAKLQAGAKGGETVSVFEVVVDRQNRQYFDVLFDKPLGQGKVGDVLDPAPATIFPTLGGTWKWQDTNALRFQPSGGLPVASEFKVEIEPEKVILPEQVFTGETEFKVRTDKFLVEEVTVYEEPALEGKAKVILRGEMRFNYPVDPTTLAPLVKIADSESAQPVTVTLETDWQSTVVGYRTEPDPEDPRRADGEPHDRRRPDARQRQRAARGGSRQGDRRSGRAPSSRCGTWSPSPGRGSPPSWCASPPPSRRRWPRST